MDRRQQNEFKGIPVPIIDFVRIVFLGNRRILPSSGEDNTMQMTRDTQGRPKRERGDTKQTFTRSASGTLASLFFSKTSSQFTISFFGRREYFYYFLRYSILFKWDPRTMFSRPFHHRVRYSIDLAISMRNAGSARVRWVAFQCVLGLNWIFLPLD